MEEKVEMSELEEGLEERKGSPRPHPELPRGRWSLPSWCPNSIPEPLIPPVPPLPLPLFLSSKPYLLPLVFLLLSLALLMPLYAAPFHLSQASAYPDSPLVKAPEPYSWYYTGWKSNQRCGVESLACSPFFESEPTVIRCLSRATWPTFPIKVVGTQSNESAYRADSFVCAAAVHAGAVTNSGGCVALQFTGSQTGFDGSISNGVRSISFNSWFPKTFTVTKAFNQRNCGDFTWTILSLQLVLMLLLSLLLGALRNEDVIKDKEHSLPILNHDQPLPRENKENKVQDGYQLFWWYCLLASGYCWAVFFGQPSNDYETALAFILPFLFITFYLWRSFVKNSLFPLSWTFESFTFYVIPFYLGVSFNFLAFILPDFGLNASIFEGSAADNLRIVFTLLIGLFLLVGACGYTVKFLRESKLVSRYLMIYLALVAAVFIGTMLCLIFNPDFKLHLHHYAVGLFLLPIFRFRSRFILFCQALMLGVFTNGVAIWGMDSIWTYQPSTSFSAQVTSFMLNFSSVNATSNEVSLSWAWNNITYGEIVGNPGENPIYNMAMNHVIIYRGYEDSIVVPNLEPETPYYFCLSVFRGGSLLGPGCLNLLVVETVNASSLLDSFGAASFISKAGTVYDFFD